MTRRRRHDIKWVQRWIEKVNVRLSMCILTFFLLLCLGINRHLSSHPLLYSCQSCHVSLFRMKDDSQTQFTKKRRESKQGGWNHLMRERKRVKILDFGPWFFQRQDQATFSLFILFVVFIWFLSCPSKGFYFVCLVFVFVLRW